MSKLYIVIQREFEYNDEVYYSQGNGGNPLKAFRNKETAIKYMNELEFQFWFPSDDRSYYHSPTEYGYEYSDYWNNGWADKVFPKEELDCWKVIEEIDPESIEEQFNKIYGDQFPKLTRNWPESVKRRFVQHAIAVEIFLIQEVEVEMDE